MPYYTVIPANACANVQGFSKRNGMPRDEGHLAHDGAEILSFVMAHHPDDSVRVHAPTAFIHEWNTERELAEWATAPNAFTAYYELTDNTSSLRGRVSTWTGALLGVITSARIYGHNFGARMVSMRVRGNNGACYYGRASWDNGSVITLRKVKG